MLKRLNRAKAYTATTGAGTITVGAAVAGFKTPAGAGAINGDKLRCLYEDGFDWEISVGTYTSAGTTISRTLIASSTGSLLNLSGAATIAVISDANDETSASVIVPPQGRLTLTSATPVLSSDVTAATTVYYTPYKGDWSPVYDYTTGLLVNRQFSELSHATTDSTTSPAAMAAYKNYDLFRWDNNGTDTLSHGPAWTRAKTVTVTIASPGVFSCTGHGLKEGFPVVFTTTGALPTGLTAGTTYFVIAAGLTANAFEVSATIGGAAVNTSGSQSGTHTATDSTILRGTGAGTTEIEMVNGVWRNKYAITNGPAAGMGVYVGTGRTNASSQIDYIMGGTGAAGGESTFLGLWNAYNRVPIKLVNYDNTGTWNYTTATMRIKNGNQNNRICMVIGLSEDALNAANVAYGVNATNNVIRETAIGLNSTTVGSLGNSSTDWWAGTGTFTVPVKAHLCMRAPLGFNYIAPLEYSAAVGTTTWYGDNGGTEYLSLFSATVMG